MLQKVIREFQQQFSAKPEYIVKAPGRVNLIGEHTDYNDGFVLPMAIDRYIWLALTPRTDHTVRIYSMNFTETKTFVLTNFHKDEDNWVEYVKGVAHMLQQDGYETKGFDAVLSGNVPTGAGLSSSAALELAVARALIVLTDQPWKPVKIAKLAQRAENEWVGMNCGIMDQMVIAKAKENHALFINCRDLSTKNVPLPHDTAIVIMDTATKRELVDSRYNERRQQCEAAAKILNVTALRDVTDEVWAKSQHLLTGDVLLRARHVMSENKRVLKAVEAMQQNNASELGELMNASHVSLRDDFAVSTKELDCIVDAAQNSVGCFGARMTGAGFGGCAVAVVKSMYADDFVDQVTEQYQHDTGLEPVLYVTGAMGGVSIKLTSDGFTLHNFPFKIILPRSLLQSTSS